VPAISTNDLKNGITLEIDKVLYQVVEFQHVKPGKGGAFVRSKLRNLRNGAVIDRTFNAGVRVEQALLEKKDMQFLYRDGDDYVFMDQETYDQENVAPSALGDASAYMVENSVALIAFYKRSSRWRSLHRSSSPSPTPSPVSRATASAAPASRPRWRPARSYRCRCSSTRATG